MDRKKLWLIKYKKGSIQGPLSSQEIFCLIDEKKIDGSESIAVYPEGRWQSISAEPVFYNFLLKHLSKTSSSSNSVSSVDSSDEGLSSATVIADVKNLQKIKKERKKIQRIKSLKQHRDKLEKDTMIYELEEEELDDVSAVVYNESPKRPFPKKILGFGLMGLAGFLFFIGFFESPKSKDDYITLKTPRWNIVSTGAKQQKDQFINKGMFHYFKGGFSSYVKAQDLLVQAAEEDNNNIYSMALLCMTYLELWPFTRQGFHAQKAVSNVVEKISILNRGGIESGLCQAVDLLLRGRYQSAKTAVESSLDGTSDSAQDVKPFLYYLQAQVLYYLGDLAMAGSYLSPIQKNFPKWAGLYIFSAKVLLRQKNEPLALKTYRHILTINSKNKTAQIQSALLGYKIAKASPYKALKKALGNAEEKAPYNVLSSAYYILAQYELGQGRTEPALESARQAYSWNPIHKSAQDLVVRLGGENILKTTKVQAVPLLAEGDRLFLQNQYQLAVGYYEKAFKADNGKNAMTAVKAAKSLWRLSYSEEAVEWLKKAVSADSEVLGPYVLMADYYTQKYDFYNAEKILRIAEKKAPLSYELMRGKAQLALRKEDYQKAIYYSERALKMYAADVESYVILSEVYAKLSNWQEALAQASRAVETDPNSIKTQLVYAKSLGYVYGADTGVNYFKKLIENYPLILEYKMGLAKYFFEDEQYEQARIALMDIIAVEPKYNEAYLYLGRTLMSDRDTANAYSAFLEAAVLNPFDPIPTFYIGLLRFQEKQYNQAKKDFEKVLDLNPFFPKVHYYIGKAAFEQKDYDTAIKQAELESQVNPNKSYAFILAGEAYEKKNKFLECANAYQKAIEYDTEDLSIYVGTARCYRKSGHIDLAQKILNKAKLASGAGTEEENIRLGDPHLYKELGAIYEIKGSYKEAEGAYCNYLNLLPQALDRQDVRTRMKRLAKLMGGKVKNCG